MGLINDYLLERKVDKYTLKVLNKNLIRGYKDIELGYLEMLCK